MDWRINMAKDTLMIHNVETDEITIRELTDEEQEIRDAESAQADAQRAAFLAAEAAKPAARQALLEKLGITEEEAKLLLS
jgi:hypothetical protein